MSRTAAAERITIRRAPQRILAAVAALALAAAGWAAPAARAHELQVEVVDAWARPAIAQGNGAVYFTLTNRESEPVTLVGASSGVARYTEIHETYVIDADAAAHEEHGHDHEHGAPHDHGDHGAAAPAGTMLGMRKVDAITVPSGETLHFAPGGYHVMLIELTQGLAWGERFPVTLYFADGHTVTFEVEVGAGPAHP